MEWIFLTLEYLDPLQVSLCLDEWTETCRWGRTGPNSQGGFERGATLELRGKALMRDDLPLTF